MKISEWSVAGPCAAFLALVSFGECLATEAPNIILETGGTETPVTGFRVLEPVSAETSWLQFDFGFATFEEPLPGTFADSATLTLRGISPAATTIVATIDFSGVLWAPPTPGGISLDPDSISRSEISFPGLSLELPHRRAFTVTAFVPEDLWGQPLTFQLDLFDNMNGQNSAAYASAPTIVPEPGSVALIAFGFLFLFGLKRRNK